MSRQTCHGASTQRPPQPRLFLTGDPGGGAPNGDGNAPVVAFMAADSMPRGFPDLRAPRPRAGRRTCTGRTRSPGIRPECTGPLRSRTRTPRSSPRPKRRRHSRPRTHPPVPTCQRPASPRGETAGPAESPRSNRPNNRRRGTGTSRRRGCRRPETQRGRTSAHRPGTCCTSNPTRMLRRPCRTARRWVAAHRTGRRSSGRSRRRETGRRNWSTPRGCSVRSSRNGCPRSSRRRRRTRRDSTTAAPAAQAADS